MTIRRQLNVLLAANFFLLGAALAAYWVILAPVDTMRKEQEVIGEVASRTLDVQLEINRLANDVADLRKPFVDAAVTRYRSAFSRVADIHLLPNLNSRVKDALEVIVNLRDVAVPGLSRLDQAWEPLFLDAERVLLSRVGVRLVRFYGRQDAKAEADATEFLRTIAGLNLNFDAVRSALATQDGAISAEIRSVEVRSLTTALSLVLLLVVLTFSGAFWITGSIGRSVVALGARLQDIAGGNLTNRFVYRRRDELSVLGGHLNLLAESIAEAMANMQELAGVNVRVKDSLRVAVQESSAATTEIEANSRSIGSSVGNLDQLVADNQEQFESIFERLHNLSKSMNEQDSQVAASASGVAQVGDSISNITRFVAASQEEVHALANQADQSRELFEEVLASVTEIGGQADEIRGIASTIAEISSQTNILAMNAAIEAAHAGDFGKGFSVVAEEIRKLSSATAQSSAEISLTVGAIIGKIGDAEHARGLASKAYQSILDGIDRALDSVKEIHDEVATMEIHSVKIQDSLDALTGTSTGTTQTCSLLVKSRLCSRIWLTACQEIA